MKKEIKWESLAARIFCAAALAVGLWLAVKYAGGAIFTVAAAIIVSCMINGWATKLSSALRLSKRLCAALLSLLLFSFGAAFFFMAVVRLTKEIEGIALWVAKNSGQISLTLAKAADLLARVGERLGLSETFDGISENAVSFIWSALYEIAACIFRYVGSFLSGIVGATPRVMLSVAVFIISVIYLSIDYDRILKNASKLIPPAALPVIKRAASRVCFGLRQYIKACAILFFLTFIEAYVGLLILKGPYALLLSLVIAFVDILPIFGAGAVLIPWAAISFATGRASFGLGLLILYGVVTAVRQIVEPYVVGEKMGVHPLASLLITFLLFYVFGPVGAFVSPLASLLLGQLLKKREE